MNYTPGPWMIDHEQGDMPFIVAEQGKKWRKPVICSLYENVTPEDSVTLGPWLQANDNAGANARLIAAAPELLAACIEVAQGYTTRGSEMARAAIAKATGELFE